MTGPINNNIAQAANLYSQTGGLQRPGGANIGGNESTIGGDGNTDFGAVLRNTVRQNIDVLRSGEQASAQAITGEANIVDVVQAVGKAELTLNTIMALRDRMVQAYNDIISMPI